MSLEGVKGRLSRLEGGPVHPPIVFVTEGPHHLTEDEAEAEIERLIQEHNGNVHIIHFMSVYSAEVNAAGLADSFATMSNDEQHEAIRAYRRKANR